jgi:hypothetical protein
VRFLADSQGCLFWYLYVPGTAIGHAVVASAKFYGTPEEDWEQEDLENDELDFVAESFESFLWRFWVENEIWYSVYYDKTPLPEQARLYLSDYRSRDDERA